MARIAKSVHSGNLSSAAHQVADLFMQGTLDERPFIVLMRALQNEKQVRDGIRKEREEYAARVDETTGMPFDRD